MKIMFPFEYRKLGDLTYHVISHPTEIKTYLKKYEQKEVYAYVGSV